MKPSMKQRTLQMEIRKRIALIAHDNRKFDLLEWARHKAGTLARHELFATGTTGRLLARGKGTVSNSLVVSDSKTRVFSQRWRLEP